MRQLCRVLCAVLLMTGLATNARAQFPWSETPWTERGFRGGTGTFDEKPADPPVDESAYELPQADPVKPPPRADKRFRAGSWMVTAGPDTASVGLFVADNFAMYLDVEYDRTKIDNGPETWTESRLRQGIGMELNASTRMDIVPYVKAAAVRIEGKGDRVGQDYSSIQDGGMIGGGVRIMVGPGSINTGVDLTLTTGKDRISGAKGTANNLGFSISYSLFFR
ncbi:MAG: porin family protein [Nitrospirota bacterium]|nr:porin family protein [Nitrospirota bacterium]